MLLEKRGQFVCFKLFDSDLGYSCNDFFVLFEKKTVNSFSFFCPVFWPYRFYDGSKNDCLC